MVLRSAPERGRNPKAREAREATIIRDPGSAGDRCSAGMGARVLPGGLRVAAPAGQSQQPGKAAEGLHVHIRDVASLG